MRSKPFKKLHRQHPDLLSEAWPYHCIEGIQQFVHQATTAFVFEKEPCFGRVCVCVTHLHRCKTSMSYLFFHAGGSSTIASLLPTKTLAIGGDTRPDQSGVPAIFHCDGKGLSQVP